MATPKTEPAPAKKAPEQPQPARKGVPAERGPGEAPARPMHTDKPPQQPDKKRSEP